MLSVKQGSIKYHFLSLWYDSTWDWTLVSQATGEHSNHLANKQKKTELILNWIVWKRTVSWHRNCVRMLSWIHWIRTDLISNCVSTRKKTILKLNWNVWNRTVYMYKNGFGINNLQWLICHKTKPVWNRDVFK